MKLSFYGAAGEVTGSCYHLQTSLASILIDFGLHQGGPGPERRNRRLPPLDFKHLDAVILTHAHLDHCGRLPLLAGAGFRNRIWATPGTIGLTDLLLRDSAAVQQIQITEESRRRARLGRIPPAPLYGLPEVEAILTLFSPVHYKEPVEIAPGITAIMHDAGHLIGSASVELRIAEPGRGSPHTIVFSADIGERGSPLLEDPAPPLAPPPADTLILESTYGDRNHKPLSATLDEFARILNDAHGSGGKILIPAFAVGRTQQLIYHLGELHRARRIRPVPVYIDSPMARSATSIYDAFDHLFDEPAQDLARAGVDPLRFKGLRFVATSAESRALNDARDIIVIAASGMCTGGRIIHHIKHNIWRPQTHMVFVGFQGRGTLGRRIVDGEKRITVLDTPLVVKAQIHTLGGFSAHAGQAGLLDWAGKVVAGARDGPPRTFLTHGEDPPRAALAAALSHRFRVNAHLPVWGETVEL